MSRGRRRPRYRPSPNGTSAVITATPIDDFDDDDDDDGDGMPEEYTAKSYVAPKLIRMPSGKSIKVKPFSIISAVKLGTLPHNLLAAAKSLLYADEETKSRAARREALRNGEETKSDSENQANLTDYIVMQLVDSFKVVDKPPSECDPERDEVSITQILECDKVALVQYVLRGERALEDFR